MILHYRSIIALTNIITIALTNIQCHIIVSSDNWLHTTHTNNCGVVFFFFLGGELCIILFDLIVLLYWRGSRSCKDQSYYVEVKVIMS